MFQTFSGNSRRPRNVNLSGRNANPFASSGGNNPLSGSKNAIAAAQQNRVARQQERERAHAASVVQRSWRKYSDIRTFREQQRSRWDQAEVEGKSPPGDTLVTKDDVLEGLKITPFDSDIQAYSQIELLLQFLDLQNMSDVTRLRHFLGRMRLTVQEKNSACVMGPWPAAYLRLQRICLKALMRDPAHHLQDSLLEAIRFVLRQLPPNTTWDYLKYYNTLGIIASRSLLDPGLIVAPFEAAKATDAIPVYEAFSHGLLECAQLRNAIGGTQALANLAGALDCKILGRAVAQRMHKMQPGDSWYTSNHYFQRRLWLLTHVVYMYRHAQRDGRSAGYASDRDFVFIVGTLLSSLVDDLILEPGLTDLDGGSEYSQKSKAAPVDPFVREQIESLVNQSSVAGLLTLIESNTSSTGSLLSKDTVAWSETRLLANYILTLLRLFPRRGDEIRMWLYLGSTNSVAGTSSAKRLPVIRYFWEAMSKTGIYYAISRDPREAITLLRPRTVENNTDQRKVSHHGNRGHQIQIDDEWRISLIFIELYIFVLRIMDDEQFFSSGGMTQPQGMLAEQTNPISLKEIQALTLFLKNLGFTMYYNAADILETSAADDQDDLAQVFEVTQSDMTNDIPQQKSTGQVNATHIAGVRGMTMDHVKGLVTGLMRAIYERDSRRPFLPKDHWLMTSRFNMTNFIDSVVDEEERRNEVQSDDEDEDLSIEDDRMDTTSNLIGTGYSQRTRRNEMMQRYRRRQFRQHYLQKVAPRQEILSNLPFFIPFTTRVQIFRRFILNDQMKRRGGTHEVDAFGMIHHSGGHQAKIRREHEFDDAYSQFYDLGANLKEPIRITFVDKFDTVEAGIDGGGVTKEFLTTVTNQAFTPSDSIDMFVANDQHLLYPNPSALEEQKDLLREVGFQEGSSTWNAAIGDLLHRYEFLGRIIAKCLYEGILIDVAFSGFFLLKWALTGGPGAAPRESGYRATINDLRDFDEGLYQGLIKLKNYPGNVEDFALNFTVTDVVSSSKNFPKSGQENKVKTLTRELIPNGSAKPVTNANRLVYISYVARHRLQIQPQSQTNAFLRGLASIIQPSWLSMFNQTELQTLVGGTASSISVPDLRANTVYGGVYVIGDDGQEHPSVQLFWQVMEEMGQDDRRKVLKFVTSTPRAPLLGFSNLNPKFSIRDAGRDETRLPSTSTCVNLLKLPMYSKKHLLKTKLLQAVNSGAGFDLS